MFGASGIPQLSSTTAAANELREDGRTTMVVRLGDRDLGAIGLMDTPRQGAAEAARRYAATGDFPHGVMILWRP